MHPVDELAEIRSQIAGLKSREGVLRQYLLQNRSESMGLDFLANVTTQSSRVFCREKLPNYILEAPALWRTREVTYVKVRPIADARFRGARPASTGVTLRSDQPPLG